MSMTEPSRRSKKPDHERPPLARRLQEARKRKGSQVEIAKSALISQSTLSDYETGDVEPPIATLAKLATILDVSLNWLIDGTDVEEPKSKEMSSALEKANRTSMPWTDDHLYDDKFEHFVRRFEIVELDLDEALDKVNFAIITRLLWSQVLTMWPDADLEVRIELALQQAERVFASRSKKSRTAK